MPFGMVFYCLDNSRSARAVVLALLNLLLILLFFRAVVIEQGLIPCNDQLHLGYPVLFEKGTDLVVQPPRKPRIVLLCRLLPFLFIPRLIISARAADRRIFFLCHSILSFRDRTDHCSDAVHDKRPDSDNAYKQCFQKPFPKFQSSFHIATSAFL
mgnify:FL=1